jgi:tRNA/tmRNA/rRNA uracil-C5-methylase (TrmA/RlmC/RlmD family)
MAFSMTAYHGQLAWGLRSVESNENVVALESCEITREELWSGAQQIIRILDQEFGTTLVWDGSAGTVRSATLRYHNGRPGIPASPQDRAPLTPVMVALFAVATYDLEIPLRMKSALSAIPNLHVHFTFSDPRANAVYFDRAQYLRLDDNRQGQGRAPTWGEANFREEDCCWHTSGEWATLVGPTSFLQVNDEIAIRLYQRVLDLPYETLGFVIDAYCGVGVLTRALAQKFEQVVGIELDVQAIKMARTTSRRLNQCRVEWIAEAAEAVFGRMGRGSSRTEQPRGVTPTHQSRNPIPDLVVLDPPRKGCQHEVLRALLTLKPSDVVYISCHPAALARDLKMLCREVFVPVSIEPFDLFPQTHHVETLVHLKRK